MSVVNTYSGRPGYITSTTGATPTAIETPFSNRADATARPFPRLYTPLPFANGTRDDCTQYFTGDDYQFNLTGTKWSSNCELAIKVYRVDTESFGVWNSGLANVSLPDCTFETGVRYCGSWYFEKDEVISSTTTDVPSSTRTTGPASISPTQTGQPSSCNE